MMLGNTFLFEFPNKNMVLQVLHGVWTWKKSGVKLEWNPTTGCSPHEQKNKSTWIGAVGLSLYLWSHEIFRLIGYLCGGWKSTKEETKMKNLLKWAQIEVNGDGRNIPSEVEISKEGINFFIPF